MEDGLAGFLNCEHIAALVGSAFAADAVGQLALVAVGALGESGGGKEVVAAPLGSPLLGVAPFRIRHCSVPFKRPRRSGEAHWRRSRTFSVLDLEPGCQVRKSIPPRIGGSFSAGTGCEIQVLATARAKPFAARLAERPAGQGKQHLLAHDIFKRKTA